MSALLGPVVRRVFERVTDRYDLHPEERIQLARPWEPALMSCDRDAYEIHAHRFIERDGMPDRRSFRTGVARIDARELRVATMQGDRKVVDLVVERLDQMIAALRRALPEGWRLFGRAARTRRPRSRLLWRST